MKLIGLRISMDRGFTTYSGAQQHPNKKQWYFNGQRVRHSDADVGSDALVITLGAVPLPVGYDNRGRRGCYTCGCWVCTLWGAYTAGRAADAIPGRVPAHHLRDPCRHRKTAGSEPGLLPGLPAPPAPTVAAGAATVPSPPRRWVAPEALPSVGRALCSRAYSVQSRIIL